MPARSPGFHHSGEWDSGYHAPALVAPLVELLAGSPLVLDGTLGVAGIGPIGGVLALLRCERGDVYLVGRLPLEHLTEQFAQLRLVVD